MKKNISYLGLGILFGTLLYKGGAASFDGLQDMFHFRNFQIFGIFFTAVPTAALTIYFIQRRQLKTINQEPITIQKREFYWGRVLGGILFGIGWGMTGTCPGPIFVQLGAGESRALFTLFGALAGTWCYSALKEKLPR